MADLELMRAEHEQAVLDFELANRDYFARFISDRGDAFFRDFPASYAALLEEQDAGVRAGYLLTDGSAVLGRFNLFFVGDGVAELGYRVAENAAGQGVATATVRRLSDLAASRHGARLLRAAVSTANVASARVLVKSGFRLVGPADPKDIGGKAGWWFELALPLHPAE